MTSITDLPVCIDHCSTQTLPGVLMGDFPHSRADRTGPRLLAAMEQDTYVGFLGFHADDSLIEIGFVLVCPSQRDSGIERALCLALREMFPRRPIVAKADEKWSPIFRECGFRIAAEAKEIR